MIGLKVVLHRCSIALNIDKYSMQTGICNTSF